MTAFWSPTAATITDSSAFVIPSSVLYHEAPASTWSNVANWKEGVAPQNGDTVVFDPSTANFLPSTPAVNDIAGLTLNAINVNNGGATPAQMIIEGKAITLSTALSNFSQGSGDGGRTANDDRLR